MKKIGILFILLIPVLLITGCANEKNELSKYVNKTSITNKGLKSYRCKVNLRDKANGINYIVLNDNNKNYNLSVSTKDYSYEYSINDEKVKEMPPQEYNSSYKFEDTDRYLDLLNEVTNIKEDKKEKDNNYKKYTFKINKKDLNKILSTFNMKTSKNGKGFTYIDKDNHVYMINYLSGAISINISYTRYNSVK